MTSMMSSVLNKLTSLATTSYTSKMFASGRWYPQPSSVGCRCMTSDSSLTPSEPKLPASKPNAQELGLKKEDAYPVYAVSRGTGKVFGLVPWKNGEMLADYVLFEESMKKSETKWQNYNDMTKEERDIYVAHLKAVKDRKLYYIDPKTKLKVMSVSQLLYQGKCCGNGCRHCPYEHVNVSDDIRKTRKWNGAFYV